MILRTAKGFYSADTFAALAAHQAEYQGAFAVIEIGKHTVDVDACEIDEDMAGAVCADLSDAIETLRDEAASVGDAATAADCGAAGTDIAALERVCTVLCDAAAQV